MGGTPSMDENQNEFINILEFYENGESTQFGEFKIYKMIKKPYEAIMCKTFISSNNDEEITRK